MPTQGTLEDEGRRLARASDPPTSHEAAESIVPHLSRMHTGVLDLVREHPGKTAAELAFARGELTNHRLSRRLPELERKGLVVRGVARACFRTGRSAATWWPK